MKMIYEIQPKQIIKLLNYFIAFVIIIKIKERKICVHGPKHRQILNEIVSYPERGTLKKKMKQCSICKLENEIVLP